LTIAPVVSLGAGRSQDQRPTFRASTKLIVQLVTVKDDKGKVIEGLTADDFILLEDGQAQTVAFCEFQRLTGAGTDTPVTALPSATPKAAPARGQDVAAPVTPEINYSNRRLVVLYFDLSAMPAPDLHRAGSDSLKYVNEHLTPADVVSVMSFQGGGVKIEQPFTDDRALLVESIKGLMYGRDVNGDGIADVVAEATAFGQDDAEFRIFNTDRQLSALQTAVAMLRPGAEQKTLIYFSSGIRLNGIDNQAQLRATINEAVRSNVTINPVDARGLVATAPLGNANVSSPSGMSIFSGTFGRSLTVRAQSQQDTLYALANDTGGRATFDTNDLSRGIVDAAEAATSYYILGYYSQNAKADGKFRQVRVRLKDGRSARLSYRDGYYGERAFVEWSDAEKERQLEEAMMLENPITEISLAMEVNFFRLTAAEYYVPVIVKLPGQELVRARGKGAVRTVIDFIGEVKDEHGVTYRNVRDKVDRRLDEGTAADLASRPLLYETGFTLLPGRYVIKMLVRDATTGRIGTYEATFAIPNLDREKQQLPISSVVVGNQRVSMSDSLHTVSRRPSDVVNPLVVDGQKLVPSVTRVFPVGRDLYFYLQAYPRDWAGPRTLTAYLTFFRGQAKVYETAPVVVTASPVQGSASISIGLSVPLKAVSPGQYMCQLTVFDSASNRVAFWRAPIVLVDLPPAPSK